MTLKNRSEQIGGQENLLGIRKPPYDVLLHSYTSCLNMFAIPTWKSTVLKKDLPGTSAVKHLYKKTSRETFQTFLMLVILAPAPLPGM